MIDKERKFYDVDFFISRFNEIRNEDCCTNAIGVGGKDERVKHDCFGHLQDNDGRYCLRQRNALLYILRNPIQIWDNKSDEFPQQTPILRLLAALRKVKYYQNIGNF